MFVAQAHSFAQQARLVVTLAWVAGYTNIITILTCATATSHVSGTVSNFGRDIAEGSWGLAAFAGMLLLTFLVGAAIAGFATELGRRQRWESIYVLPMVLEAMLLAVFALGVEFRTQAGQGFDLAELLMAASASMAMGIQNATITRISNGVIRTTHMTGVLTDLGLEGAQYVLRTADQRAQLGQASAREILTLTLKDPLARRLALLASVVALFGFGAGLGAWVYVLAPRFAMFPPVLFLLWVIYQDTTRPIAEVAISDLVRESELFSTPELRGKLSVYHLRREKHREGEAHRLPNFVLWADALPPDVSVAVLDLHASAGLDANAALELRAVLNRLHQQGRRLILAGIGPDQFPLLRDAGVSELLNPDNICPDVELAIARAVNLVHEEHAARRQAGPIP